ncbi:MAG TPA: PAS domain-containing sensor histidine kinase [Bacteroidales bacterium]|nr:PAS domain-containing sensor histidine kinase [Bacteroidales bacterium]
MGSLDMRTVIFSFVLINIIGTLIITFLWRQYRSRYNGTGHLVSAFSCQMLAYILIILRGSIPEILSLGLSNSLSVAGIFIGYIGLEKYTGVKTSKIPFYVLFGLMVLTTIFFTYIRPIPAARYFIISAVYMFMFGLCAWLMLYRVPEHMAGLTSYTGIVFSGLSFLSALKIADFIIRSDKPADYFKSDGFEAVVMISFGMMIILLIVSIAIMFSNHLLRDIKSGEEKFSTVFHTAPNAIVLLSYPEGRIIEVNSKFLEISGFEIAEVTGKTPIELNLWVDESQRLEVVNELNENRMLSKKECTFRKKSNELFTGLLSIKIISIKNGMMYVSSLNDITERKRLQDVIRHERNLLRTLIDHLPDPVTLKDHEGKYLLNNEAHLHVLGVDSQEEVFGKTAFDFFPEEDAQIYTSDDANVLRTGRMIIDKVEHAKHLETGFPYWHMTSKIPIKDDSGKPMQILTISHDITERKRADDILKETDEFNRSLLMTIPFGMDVVDETGTILFMGEKFRKMFGGDAIGKKCWDLYCDSGVQCDGCPLKNGIKTGTTSTYEAHDILGGKIFDINHTGMIFHGKKAMLEIFHDITERKKSENDLIRSKEKAEESDRLKTAFLHNISHEIRTPMNAIVGFANLLREPGLSQEEHDSYTYIISRSSHHLLSIVNDVIEISNVEAGRLKISLSECNLTGIFDDLYAQFKTTASEKEIEFSISTPPAGGITRLTTDCTKFMQVMTNLLNNAFKFTSSGKIIFGYTIKDPYIEFFVSDTGIGIEHDSQQKIFERFYQVDNTVTRLHEGTGIGLSISKAYVELLGGKIWLRSSPGKGSVFYFTIPFRMNNHNTELQL